MTTRYQKAVGAGSAWLLEHRHEFSTVAVALVSAVDHPAADAGYQRLLGSPGIAGVAEDEAGTWLALIATDGLTLLWEQRDAEGAPVGAPRVFYRTAPMQRARGAVLSEVTVRGLRICIDGPLGELREFKQPDGTTITTQRTVPYGYIAPIKAKDADDEAPVLGDDGEGYDVYLGPNPMPERVYVFTQLHKSNRRYNEQKAVIGCASMEEADGVIRAHTHPDMFGRMGSLSWDDFEKQVHAAVGGVLRVETDEDVVEYEAMKAIASAEGLEEILGKTGGGLLRARAGVTNFPRLGDNKTLAFSNSTYPRFDLEYAEQCRASAPEVFRSGMEYEPRQFDILARVARMGGVPKMKAEALAIRCREAMGDKHGAREDVPGVCLLMRWCAVGALGEAEMKHRIDAALAKVVESVEPPSGESSTDSGDSSDTTQDRAHQRITQQAPVLPDHRSEDAGNPGPLSQRTPRIPMPEKTHVDDPAAGLFAQLHALKSVAPDIFATLFAGEDASGSASPSGVPRRAATAAPGQPGRAGAQPAGPDASKSRVLTATIDRKTIDEENREVWFIASTGALDSHEEIVDQSNWGFKRFDLNPVILWSHRSGDFPIGRAVERKVEGGRLLIKVRFSRKNPVGVLAWELVLEDMLRACSVGFMPGRCAYEMRAGKEVCVLYDNELYELSICSIPSNPESVTLMERRMVAALQKAVDELGLRMRASLDLPRSREPAAAPAAADAPPVAHARGADSTTSAVVIDGPSTRNDMTKTKVLGAADIKQMRDNGGSLKIVCDCGTEHALDARQLTGALTNAEGRAEEERNKAVVASDALEQAKKDLSSALKTSAERLTALTLRDLEPMTGLESWQISVATAGALAKIRSTDEPTYTTLVTDARAKFDAGVKDMARKAEEARKAVEAGTGTEAAAKAAQEAAAKAREGAATSREPPTRAADPTAPATASAGEDMGALFGGLEERAKAASSAQG